MFEAQDKQLLRRALGTGTQDLNLFLQTLAPFDCYVLGYCIAYSDCLWKLTLYGCKLGKEGMRMLARGSGDCLHNVQKIKLSGNDVKNGVTHLGNRRAICLCCNYGIALLQVWDSVFDRNS